MPQARYPMTHSKITTIESRPGYPVPRCQILMNYWAAARSTPAKPQKSTVLSLGRGTNLQFGGAIDTVPTRLSAESVLGCGARCERSILAVFLGAL